MILHVILQKKKRQYFFQLQLFIIIILISICVAQYSFARGFEFKSGESSAVIPFKNVDGLIVMPFQMGNKTLHLILDTGIRGILLFNEPGSFGLKSKSRQFVSFSGIGLGGTIKGRVIPEVKMESENIIGTGLAVVLVPKNDFNKLLGDINGIIGYDIFSKFLVTIDYKSNNIILSDPRGFKPVNLVETDLKIIHSKPFISTLFSHNGLDEKEHLLLIDTGGNFELLLIDEINVQDKKGDTLIGKGLTGNVRGKSYVVNDITWNNLRFLNFSIIIPSSKIFKNKEMMSDRDGMIGAKFLQRFNMVIFDYANKKVYFQKGTLLAKK